MEKLYWYDWVFYKKNWGNDKIIKEIEEFYNFLVDNNIPVGIFIDNEKIKINHNNKQVIIDITRRLKQRVLERKLQEVDLLAYYRFFQGLKELEHFINKNVLNDILENINDF